MDSSSAPEHPHYLRRFRSRIGLYSFLLRNIGRKRFECPVCGFRGPFMDVAALTGLRRHARCPRCKALERHRIQHVVFERILEGRDTSRLDMLHIAPEPFFRNLFSRRFGRYITADLDMQGVDYHIDLCSLPFAPQSFDLVFASHVLEHVPDDAKAIAEIRRVLRAGGLAILPVPLVVERTVEYPEPNPHESGHVRAPGPDYFDRYREHFSRVELVDSDSLPGKFQLHVYEDRSHWPTADCPLRTPMQGERHVDVVPVCHA